MRKLETITAYVALFSELLFLGIGLVILSILIDFSKNFKALMELAGGM